MDIQAMSTALFHSINVIELGISDWQKFRHQGQRAFGVGWTCRLSRDELNFICDFMFYFYKLHGFIYSILTPPTGSSTSQLPNSGSW
jgi:hypothetical protein